MIEPAAPALRAARAGAIGGVLVAVSFAAHVVGGGDVPGVLATAGIVGAVAVVASQVARRRMRVPALLAVLGGGQAALHYALMAVSYASAGCMPRNGNAAHAAHAGHAAQMPVACDGAMAAMHADDLVVPGWAMLLAHAVATLVCALLLARGEDAVHAIAGLWSRIVPRLAVLPALTITTSGPRLAPAVTPWRPRREVFLRVSPRRGPPAAMRPPLLARPA